MILKLIRVKRHVRPHLCIENKPVVDSEVHKTTSYKSQEELKESYKSNYPKAKNDALRSLLTRNINNISNVLNYDYGLTPRTVKASFESLSTKDHPDLAKYDKMKTTTIQAFSKMTAADNSAFLEAIKPVMEFWIAEEKKYDPNNKDEKKMNFALRQNIAIAYIWAEDW